MRPLTPPQAGDQQDAIRLVGRALQRRHRHLTGVHLVDGGTPAQDGSAGMHGSVGRDRDSDARVCATGDQGVHEGEPTGGPYAAEVSESPAVQERHPLLSAARAVGVEASVLGDPLITADDLEIGDQLKLWSVHRQTVVGGPGRIRIGDRVFLNAGVVLHSEVAITIGDDVALSNEVYVMDTDSHGLEGQLPHSGAVTIGRGSWLGARAIVLPGVTIGEQSVVAAGSVVTRDVPDRVLVAGNPARVIRELTYPAHCKRAWHDQWCYCPGSLLGPPAEA